MSFAIDEAKVRELLEAKPPQYAVTASHIATVEAPAVKTPSSAVYGTSFTTPVAARDAREYIASLRRRIVESGIRLKTPAELDSEIEEIKDRTGR